MIVQVDVLCLFLCELKWNEYWEGGGGWVIADQMIISGQVAETEPCLSLACGWWRQEGEKEEPWPWAHLSLHYLPSLKQHTESVETWVQSWEEIWLSVKCLCLWFYEQVRLGFPAHETGHLTMDTAEKPTVSVNTMSITITTISCSLKKIWLFIINSRKCEIFLFFRNVVSGFSQDVFISSRTKRN